MIDTPASPSRRRTTWRERAFVLGGLALATLCTAASPVLGTEFVAFTWLAAIAWTVPASLAVGLWRGFRRRDWSAFQGCELPDDRDDEIDWSTRTGTYAWLGDMEDRLLHDDDHLRSSHGL